MIRKYLIGTASCRGGCHSVGNFEEVSEKVFHQNLDRDIKLNKLTAYEEKEAKKIGNLKQSISIYGTSYKIKDVREKREKINV